MSPLRFETHTEASPSSSVASHPSSSATSLQGALQIIGQLEASLAKAKFTEWKSKTERQSAERDLGELRNVVREVNFENDGLVNDLQCLIEENENLSKRLQDQKKSTEQLQSELVVLEEESETLGTKLEHIQSKSGSQEQQKNVMSEMRECINNQLKVAITEKKAIEDAVNQLREDIENVRDSSEHLVKEKIAVKRKLNEVTRRYKCCSCDASLRTRTASCRDLGSSPIDLPDWRDNLYRHISNSNQAKFSPMNRRKSVSDFGIKARTSSVPDNESTDNSSVSCDRQKGSNGNTIATEDDMTNDDTTRFNGSTVASSNKDGDSSSSFPTPRFIDVRPTPHEHGGDDEYDDMDLMPSKSGNIMDTTHNRSLPTTNRFSYGDYVPANVRKSRWGKRVFKPANETSIQCPPTLSEVPHNDMSIHAAPAT